jgi:poly(A) polymerase
MHWKFQGTVGLQIAREVAERLRRAGFAAYFAGGCVRDLLLARAAKDFDVATSARPAEVVRLFAETSFRTMAVGAHFGVILVVSEAENQRVEVEVATFRHDGAYLDGRRPEKVEFSLDPREDVLRRDFTINGMLLDPSLMVEETSGRARHDGCPEVEVPESAVLDFVGGRADLAARLVRAIGDPARRFEEDKLRMLRGVRFAARLEFRIEPETLRAIQRYAPQIWQVSAERVREELTRMLTEGGARSAFEMLDESGLLAEVLPEIARMKGVEQPPEYHPEGDVWVHTLMLLEQLPAGVTCELAWGFLLHDVGKPATFQPPDPARASDRIRFNGHVEVGVRIAEVMLERLRFSKDSRAQILSLIKHHMQFGDVKAMKESTLKRFVRIPKFDEHLALHRADCLASHGKLGMWEYAKEAYERDEPAQVRPKWLVTGKELIAAGYPPDAAFKKMLRTAEDAQLEGRVRTVEDGLRLVEREFGHASEYTDKTARIGKDK